MTPPAIAAPLCRASAGCVVTGKKFGDAVITVLAPDADLVVDVPSLVLRVERGPFSVLFTGDATDQGSCGPAAAPG